MCRPISIRIKQVDGDDDDDDDDNNNNNNNTNNKPGKVHSVPENTEFPHAFLQRAF
jgi:hypothetical protein